MTMLWLALGWACQVAPEPDDPPDDPVVVSSCPVQRQALGLGVYTGAWEAPTGEIVAVAPRHAAVRVSAGVWLDEEVPTTFDAFEVDGSDLDHAWGLGSGGLWARNPAGTWVLHRFPFQHEGEELRDLHVVSVDEVLVLVDSGYDTAIDRFDGTRWTRQVGPLPIGGMRALEALSDGTLILAGADGVRTEVEGWDAIPTDEALGAFQALDVAPDGTVAAAAGTSIALGTAEGLVSVDVPFEGVLAWHQVLARAHDDVWVVGHRWDGVARRGVILHYDGVTWEPSLVDAEEALWALADAGGDVVAVGGGARRLALVGGAGGWRTEVERFGVDGLVAIAVDDVTGVAHGVGPTTVSEDSGTGWVGRPMPFARGSIRTLAASGGRVAYVGAYGLLHVEEPDGRVATTEPPVDDRVTYWSATGADGALFVAGWAQDQTTDAQDRPVVLRDVGAGWEEVDLGGLPAVGNVFSAWADGPEDLWLGLAEVGEGRLAHWDGSSWEMMPTRSIPAWLARQPDGRLWMSLSVAGLPDPLWTWDGTELAPVPDVPHEVWSAHALANGRLLVMGSRDPEGQARQEFFFAQRSAPDVWEDIEVLDGPLSPVVGTQHTAWASLDGSDSWTMRCPVRPSP